MVEKNQISNKQISDFKIFVHEKGLSAREAKRAQAILMFERGLSIGIIIKIIGLKI